MPEVSKMGYYFLRRAFRNVSVSKEILHKLVDGIDTDADGRISLSEMAIAIKMLWTRAMGKVKAPKTKVLD